MIEKGGYRIPRKRQVTILRSQRGPGLKWHSEIFGPYKIISVLLNDRYLVKKVGEHDGPLGTSTSDDHMKAWTTRRKPDFNPDFEDELSSDYDISNEDVTDSRMADCWPIVFG